MRKHLDELRRRGALAVVEREVDPRFELAAVTREAQARDADRALLFTRVRGAAMPVVANVYGSRARLAEAIGTDVGGFCRHFAALCEPLPAGAAGSAAGSAGAGDAAASDDDPMVEGRLSDLPQVVYHERDGGAYLTSAVFVAKEPDSGVPNLSFHRSMMVSDGELRVRLGASHDLARYQAKAEARGEPLEAALLIGVPPSVFLAACASLPYEASELELAARIEGRPLPMRRARTVDLELPAEVEVVVEGRFLPGVRRPEGPFGEFMGYYVEVGDNHVFEVTRVAWRRDAVFHALVCQSPEDIHPLELAVATRIYRNLSQQVRGVLDVTVKSALLATIVKLEQQYEGHARHALLAAVGAYPDYAKMVIAVDADVDAHDYEDVFWAFLTRGRADRRTWVLDDIPGFYRDPQRDHWGRLLIDATKPWGREHEFERKRIPGRESIRLEDWLPPPGRRA